MRRLPWGHLGTCAALDAAHAGPRRQESGRCRITARTSSCGVAGEALGMGAKPPRQCAVFPPKAYILGYWSVSTPTSRAITLTGCPSRTVYSCSVPQSISEQITSEHLGLHGHRQGYGHRQACGHRSRRVPTPLATEAVGLCARSAWGRRCEGRAEQRCATDSALASACLATTYRARSQQRTRPSVVRAAVASAPSPGSRLLKPTSPEAARGLAARPHQ